MSPAPDVVRFDPSLPYEERPVSGLLINRGCPPGYFAQLVGPGEYGAIVVTIPGIVTNQAVRCRLMESSTAATIQEESGTTFSENLAIYTDAVQDTIGQIGEAIRFGTPWVALALAALAVLMLTRR